MTVPVLRHTATLLACSSTASAHVGEQAGTNNSSPSDPQQMGGVCLDCAVTDCHHCGL
jgi:hypothetical protein